MDALIPICIVGFFVLGTYKIVELFVRRKERIALIEKFALLWENSKDSNSLVKLPAITLGDTYSGAWPLRISLLLIGVGAGCLLSFFIQVNYFDSFHVNSYRDWVHEHWDLVTLINFASITTLGGLGLLIAYLIERRKDKKSD